MERSDIQQFRDLELFQESTIFKICDDTSAKTIAENNRKQIDKSRYYLSKDGCIMICLIHYKVIKACYQSVTKSLQTHWNRGVVLFVSGSDHLTIDARSLRSTFILTAFHLPFVAFLRL